MLKQKLKGSVFDDPTTIRSMIDAFEKDVGIYRGRPAPIFSSDYARQLKPHFYGGEDQYELKFGTNRDDDPNVGIYKGRITLSNKDLKQVFDPVINQIVESCSSIVVEQKAKVMFRAPFLHILNVVKYVLIVGGFGESRYLRNMLSRALDPYEVQIITSEDYV